MIRNNEEEMGPLGLIKLALISLPLALFIGYLYWHYKLSNWELVALLTAIWIPLLLIIKHYQSSLDFLSRHATLQFHDNKATKDSQLLLMSIMEKLSDPLLILDSHNRILMANKSAHELLGNHILKQDISVFIRNSNLDEALLSAQTTGRTSSCEIQFGRQNPKDYLTRIHLFDLTANHDVYSKEIDTPDKQYIFIALYDISAMKRTDKMRADFVANASHELRTPLASILGFVETLQGPAKNDPEAHERFLKIMFDEANRMSRLIEDLLSLSRIERDQHIPPSDKVNLTPLIERVINVLEPQAKDKNMIVTIFPSGPDELTGDHDQLTQVFQNLIENAIKYGRAGTEIKVSHFINPITEGEFIPKEINITIINEGAGIQAQHLPRLMERFYRVDSARSRSLGGTGLGLAIVKHIIQRHKGHIHFESVINSTTKVTLNLPI